MGPTEPHSWSERRDNRRRGECLCRTIKRLLSADHALGTDDLADDALPLAGAQRILSRFKVKGFVRRQRDRWVATPLLNGCPLVRVDALP
jgi:hypothetical protein